jgi:hypothetical protein
LSLTDIQKPNLLILSGEYCDSALAAEFGMLPPAFLPLSNNRLFEAQIENYGDQVSSIFLTVPKDFPVPSADMTRLNRYGVNLLPTEAGLSLKQATLTALRKLPGDESLALLFGDTLMVDFDLSQTDQIAVAATDGYFPWADVSETHNGLSIQMGYQNDQDKRNVACGLYTFHSADDFLKVLNFSPDFHTAVEMYSRQHGLKLLSGIWYDFGHLPLFFRSRKDMLVSRAFNNIKSDGRIVHKSSIDKEKMRAEANWFDSIPESIRIYTPQFFGLIEAEGRSGYSSEYLYLPTLSDLAVFGRLPLFVWRRILNSCFDFQRECRKITEIDRMRLVKEGFCNFFFDSMISTKSTTRFSSFLDSRGWQECTRVELNGCLSLPLGEILYDCIANISQTSSEHLAYWHGDFFFGNLFFDFRAQKLQVIDPRGRVARSHLSLFGDYRYDLAKLCHSIMGGYDVLLAERSGFETLGDKAFMLPQNFNNHQDGLMDIFSKYNMMGKPVYTPEILAMTCLLFLSMLPLHADSQKRQNAFLSNAIRLHQMMKDLKQ